MSKPESFTSHHEVHKQPRGEELIATYAGRKVREYDSYDPRLVIDVLKDGSPHGKLICDKFTQFEMVSTRLDKVSFTRGHHKARFILGMGGSVLTKEGFRHQVYSPEGLIGYAKGDNLDYYLASLFYDDEEISRKVKEGQGSFDSNVQRYLEKELNLPGLFRK